MVKNQMQNMEVSIPAWFYGLDSIMYFVASIIGFLLTFYFYRIYALSSQKNHQYVYLAFLILSLGFSVLTVSSLYGYIKFITCEGVCSLQSLDLAFSFEDFSYLTYFGFSLTAYVMLIFAYLDENIKFSKLFILLFLVYLVFIAGFLTIKRSFHVWYAYSEYFHLTSLVMMIFVLFRTFVNYNSEKSASSFLVMFSFLLLAVFHLFYLFSFINEFYVFAHVSLLSAFFVLLVMTFRVKR